MFLCYGTGYYVKTHITYRLLEQERIIRLIKPQFLYYFFFNYYQKPIFISYFF